jgi:hypothetical protein
MLTVEGKPIAPPASPAVGEEITFVRAGSNVAVVPLEPAACEIQAEVAVRVSVIVRAQPPRNQRPKEAPDR